MPVLASSGLLAISGLPGPVEAAAWSLPSSSPGFHLMCMSISKFPLYIGRQAYCIGPILIMSS